MPASRRPRKAGRDGQLSFDEFLWAEPERARDEQVRSEGDAPLAADRPGALPDDRGQGDVLHRARDGRGAGDPGASSGARGPGPPGGGVPGEGRPVEHGEVHGGERSALRDGAVRRSAGRGGGRAPSRRRGQPREGSDATGHVGGKRGHLAAPRFTPGTQDEDLAPSGARARVRANLQALHILERLEAEDRPATAQEQQELSRWCSWGAVPQIFDRDRDDWAEERAELQELLGEAGWAAARRTTLNAHYTHPAIAGEMWRLAGELGFREGRVLEPGAGAGVFIGLAPDGADITGVELDDTTAAIAQALYPAARIHARSFANMRMRDGSFDLAIGNVPFGDVRLHDPRHNRQRHSIHNHFIIKSLALTRPGGLMIVLSSHYTLDAANPAARIQMNELADLLGALRLPTGAHRRAAGTDALTDLLVFRRRPPGAEPASDTWVQTRIVELAGGSARVNEHFLEHPDRILGDLSVGTGMYNA